MLRLSGQIIKLRCFCLLCTSLLCITAFAACGGGNDNNNVINNISEDDTNPASSTTPDTASNTTPNTAPTAAITSPVDGNIYTYGDTITFTGSGTDAEDGALSGASLVWTSDLDGSVGTGASFTLNDLSWGDHTITLTATDSDAETASASISVSVKAWENPDTGDGISLNTQPAFYPQVAMDDSGNAIISWYQRDGSNYQIFKSEYRDGAWTHPASLLDDHISPDGYEATPPQVAMDNNGNAIIVWKQSDGSYNHIFMSEYRDGEWDHPDDISDSINPNGGEASYPQVAMDNNGNAIITWYQWNGATYQIFMSEYRNQTWTHPAITGGISEAGYGAYDPQVAMDDNSNAVITWRQATASGYQIFKSEYRNGGWTHPALSDNISYNGSSTSVYAPQVAMGNNGDAVITWHQDDGNGDAQIFKSEYRNGEWTHPSALTDNISPDEDAYDPQVAMDNNGNTVITWEGEDGSGHAQIFKSEYRNEAWTHPTALTDNISPDGEEASYPQVAMDGNGNAVITWQQYDGSNNQIFKSEYRNGAWTRPTGLTDNISPDGDAYEPQVAMDGNGNAIITWYQPTSSNYQIFKSEYN